MKYLTETKVCEPDKHRLGIVDGDKQVILCATCMHTIGSWEEVSISKAVTA